MGFTLLNTVPSYAQIALAMLGEKKYLSEIIDQVDDKNIFVQNVGIRKLAYVGGKIAYKTFFRLLDDTKYRVETPTLQEIENARKNGYGIRKGDELVEPRSFLVMELLAKMVSNPPVSPNMKPDIQHIQIWKGWFEINKQLIQ